MAKYSIGVDFGTLSVRAIVSDVKDGSELACAVYDYPHGVMSENLPDGDKLPPDWALQHPQDYLDGLSIVVHQSVSDSGIDLKDIIGIGIDFTSNTFLPVDEQYEPLCLTDKWQNNPMRGSNSGNIIVHKNMLSRWRKKQLNGEKPS